MKASATATSTHRAGPPPHEALNNLAEADARLALLRCCGSRRWAAGVLNRRPFVSVSELMWAADETWACLARPDYLEAFAHHPEIGADLGALARRFQPTLGWSSEEQAGVAQASEGTLLALCDANQRYRERFGYIFIVCASGLSAAEMLAAVRARLANEPGAELAIAAAEQAKITRLRLAKL